MNKAVRALAALLAPLDAPGLQAREANRAQLTSAVKTVQSA